MKRTSKFMPVILKVNLRSRGNPGDIVKVKRGYAVNFLLPNEMAVRASEQNMQVLEKEKEAWVKSDDIKKSEALAMKKTIENSMIEITRSTIDGFKLYGSVSAKDIAQELENMKAKVKREDIVMKPIREVGEFELFIYIYGDIKASCKVIVHAESDLD